MSPGSRTKSVVRNAAHQKEEANAIRTCGAELCGDIKSVSSIMPEMVTVKALFNERLICWLELSLHPIDTMVWCASTYRRAHDQISCGRVDIAVRVVGSRGLADEPAWSDEDGYVTACRLPLLRLSLSSECSATGWLCRCSSSWLPRNLPGPLPESQLAVGHCRCVECLRHRF